MLLSSFRGGIAPARAHTTQPAGPDRLDQTRDTGRGTVRPTVGDGVGKPVIANKPGLPGFPTAPTPPKTGDGSGAHGVRSPGIGDRLSEQVAYRLADAADAIGLNNAARHMRHYLGNSGGTLAVDPTVMRRDMPAIARAMDASFDAQIRDVAQVKVAGEFRGKPMEFQITAPWNGGYATKGQSQDWFYAIGGFSYAHTANVRVTANKDGSAHVEITSSVHVFDRYNWDGGKAVTIGPVTVTDEQLGKMHKVGLAQEFEVRGTADGPRASFDVPRR